MFGITSDLIFKAFLKPNCFAKSKPFIVEIFCKFKLHGPKIYSPNFPLGSELYITLSSEEYLDSSPSQVENIVLYPLNADFKSSTYLLLGKAKSQSTLLMIKLYIIHFQEENLENIFLAHVI